MCELIALGSLHLHGDLPLAQQQSIKKAWNAEQIMKLLHNNHPFVFPQPVERIRTEQGVHIQANSKPDALTYSEFKKLYSECGEVLHRGSIRTAHAATFCSREDYEKVTRWQHRLVTLMNEHLIGRVKELGFYVVSLRTESGYPECSIYDMNGVGQLNVRVKKLVVSDEITHAYVSNRRKN
jgi:hypothetical protein